MSIIEELREKKSLRVLGLFAGDAGDGMDAALIEVEKTSGGVSFRGVSGHSVTPYPKEVREALLELTDTGAGSIRNLSRLHIRLGMEFAECGRRTAQSAGIDIGEIDLCAVSGHPVVLLPKRPTEVIDVAHGHANILQLGAPAIVSENLSVPVVSDFAASDIAAGGNGRHVLEAADTILFHEKFPGSVILRLGGVTTVSVVPAEKEQPPMAFAVGPGTVLLDALTQRATLGEKLFDKDGDLSAGGDTNWGMLKQLHEGGFGGKKPPKTAGRSTFLGKYLEDFWEDGVIRGVRPSDLLTTTGRYILESFAMQLDRFIRPNYSDLKRVIITGGGAFNVFLLDTAKTVCKGMEVVTGDAAGVPPKAHFAAAAAVIAAETLHEIPGNNPVLSGAEHPAVLGRITFPPHIP